MPIGARTTGNGSGNLCFVVDEVEVLHGGMVNLGTVVRVGDEVLRPAAHNSATIHRLLRYLLQRGVAIAPEPIALTDDGRERLRFIPGDVAIPPYPRWAQSDETLASITRLVREMHTASAGFAREPGDAWSAEGADGERGRPVICHNDVCLENIVFRGGAAVALLDWEFAAPGRPVRDLAKMARMCIPVDDDQSAARLGWIPGDRPFRARLICETYGLPAADRRQFLIELDASIERHTAWVLHRVEQGDRNVIAMWDAAGGAARYDRRRAWWDVVRPHFQTALN
jgi:hypothetical protein